MSPSELCPDGSQWILTGTDVSARQVVDWFKADLSIDDIVVRRPSVHRDQLVSLLAALHDAASGTAVSSDDIPGALVVSDPRRRSGVPTFVGTRLPISTLFDHLAEGHSISVVVDDFEIDASVCARVLDAALSAAIQPTVPAMTAAE